MNELSATAEEMDFIRAVIANPDDDAPRLAFSDWLRERGDDEAADAIARQCNGNPVPNGMSRDWDTLNVFDWYETTNTSLAKSPSRPLSWRHGFIQCVACPATWWIDNVVVLTKHHPIKTVDLTGRVEFYTRKKDDGIYFEMHTDECSLSHGPISMNQANDITIHFLNAIGDANHKLRIPFWSSIDFLVVNYGVEIVI